MNSKNLLLLCFLILIFLVQSCGVTESEKDPQFKVELLHPYTFSNGDSISLLIAAENKFKLSDLNDVKVIFKNVSAKRTDTLEVLGLFIKLDAEEKIIGDYTHNASFESYRKYYLIVKCEVKDLLQFYNELNVHIKNWVVPYNGLFLITKKV